MAQSKMISFAELIPGRDASVRHTDDKLLYAVDLTMVVHGSDRNVASKVISPRNLDKPVWFTRKILINQFGLPEKS